VSHTIFIIDPDPQTLASLARMLSDARYHVATATTFEDASAGLAQTKPDAIIADIRLGAYNGLHLVFRARGLFPDVVGIVTDASLDSVLQADAAAANVVYLVKPLDRDVLLHLLDRRLRERPDPRPTHARRWPRKRTEAKYPAVIGTRRAKVIEISYGGLRLETEDAVEGEVKVGRAQTVDLPTAGLTIHARSVWTRRLESGRSWSGVEIDDTNPVVIDAWRRFVDKS
jgi:DNA-binding response OmpR family regulator